jgi:hypothetical protein
LRVDDPGFVMYVLCRSKFGSTPTYEAKEGEMPTDEAQQLEDLTVANETLREENEKLREALVNIDQFAATMGRVHGTLLSPQEPYRHIQAIVKDAIWTPTPNVADPETF